MRCSMAVRRCQGCEKVQVEAENMRMEEETERRHRDWTGLNKENTQETRQGQTHKGKQRNVHYMTQPKNTSDSWSIPWKMQECCIRVLSWGSNGSDNSGAFSDTRRVESSLTCHKSRWKRNLHCFSFYSRTLCWILWFEFDLQFIKRLFPHQQPSQHRYSPTAHTDLHIPLYTPKTCR